MTNYTNVANHHTNGNGTQAPPTDVAVPEDDQPIPEPKPEIERTGPNIEVKDGLASDPWIGNQIGRVFVAIADLSVSPHERLVLLQLARSSMKYGFCWAAKTTIAEYLGIHRNCVNGVIESLADKKLIAIGTYKKKKKKVRDAFFLQHPDQWTSERFRKETPSFKRAKRAENEQKALLSKCADHCALNVQTTAIEMCSNEARSVKRSSEGEIRASKLASLPASPPSSNSSFTPEEEVTEKNSSPSLPSGRCKESIAGKGSGVSQQAAKRSEPHPNCAAPSPQRAPGPKEYSEEEFTEKLKSAFWEIEEKHGNLSAVYTCEPEAINDAFWRFQAKAYDRLSSTGWRDENGEAIKHLRCYLRNAIIDEFNKTNWEELEDEI